MTEEIPEQPVRVGIGLVRRGDRFLIRQRLAGTAMAGFWEFPGGKCEPGESLEEATRRECREELGFEVVLKGLREVIRHCYPHAWVEMFYFDGEPLEAGAEPSPGSGFRWVEASALGSLVFPEANEPILLALAWEFVDRASIEGK